MLYLAIPAHNEVATIGVLLWRLRSVLAEFPREYEVVVYDDASTDETADVAEQYMHAMPVTVLRGARPLGYAGAVNALVRHIAANTRYPRRDAMLLFQGDFTDPPGIVPEFARRFEGGADVVVGERTAVADAPRPVRRLFAAAAWALKPFVRVEGVSDLTGSMRLMRISALRDLLRTVGDEPVCDGDSWTANADLLLRLVPHARRVETVPVEPTYGVRTRDTRRVTVRDALAALRWAWRARGRRAAPTSAPESTAESGPRSARPAGTSRRRDEPEVTVDRLRERSRERDRLRGESEPKGSNRDVVRGSDRARPVRTEEQKAQRRQEQRGDPREPTREKREPTREERPTTSAALRPPRPPRADRPVRGGRVAPAGIDDTLMLDDPFAGSANRGGGIPVVDSPIPSHAAPPHEPIDTPPPIAHVTVDVHQNPALDTSVESNDTSDIASDANAPDESALDVGGDEASPGAEGTERKRRRNRRSRRRKSRSRAEDSDEITDRANPTSRNVSTAAALPANPYADEPDPGATQGSDRDAEHAADDAADHAADATDDVGSAARAKRRGRRGRRGGSRRSRGRGRDTAADVGSDPVPPPASSSDSE